MTQAPTSKAAPSRTDTAQTRQHDNQTATQTLADAGPAALGQRVLDKPQSLQPRDLLYLQRTVGNQAVAALLGRRSPPPTIQPKLTVGPASDRYEEEADRIADGIQRSLSTGKPRRADAELVQTAPAISRLQRSAPIGAAGGALDGDVERLLRHTQGSGSSMPHHVRSALEPKLGANLGEVKIHTGTSAEQLNRQLGAKAFTHKNHIYYAAGQRPGDLKLTAHEAVHTIQQGATKQHKSPNDTLQRVYQHPANSRFFSHVLPRQEITASSGVITASATGGVGGGHTILIFEHLDRELPVNKKVDLTAGGGDVSSGSHESGPDSSQTTSGVTSGFDQSVLGSTGSGSSTTETIQINISDASKTSLARLADSKKRSWVVTKSQINKGMDEAIAVQADMKKHKKKYSYKLFGRSLFAKNAMNCASFGERVLRKAGLDASATSFWFGAKTPAKLASGPDVGYTPDEDFPALPPKQPELSKEDKVPDGTDYIANDNIMAGTAPGDTSESLSSGDKFKVTDKDYNPKEPLDQQATHWVTCWRDGRTFYALAMDITENATVTTEVTKQPPPNTFDYIPQPVYRQVTFTENKTLPGDDKEFYYQSDPQQILTFKSDPQGDYDLPLRIFKIIVFAEKGLAQLEPPTGQCKLRFAYVKLSDLFSSTGELLKA